MSAAGIGDDAHHKKLRYCTAHLWALSLRVSVALTLLSHSNAQGFELTTTSQANHENHKCNPSSGFTLRPESQTLSPEGQTLMQVRALSKDSHVEHVFVDPVDFRDSDEILHGHGFTNTDLSGLSADVRSAVGFDKPKWRIRKTVKKGRGVGPWWWPWEENITSPHLNISCGSPIHASDTEIDGVQAMCPKQCPYFAELVDRPCLFKCVKATDCGINGTDPQALVPDSDLYGGSCRSCLVAGCKKCAPGGNDTCAACMAGYTLQEDGGCRATGLISWSIAIALVSVPVAFVLVWLLDLFCRPSVNHKGVVDGNAYRERVLLRQEQPTAIEDQCSRGRGLYPLSTNLTRHAIAGRGTLLFFNYQMALIVWSVLLLVGWYCTATFADGFNSDLFILGTRLADFPLDYCIIIHWGHKRQQELLWVKWGFCFGSYALSFILALAYSVKQSNTYAMLDDKQTTMMDYAAHVWDLPKEPGSERVEEDLKVFLGTSSGENVVGVSVPWDTSSSPIDVSTDFEEEAETTAIRLCTPHVLESSLLPLEEEPHLNPVRRAFNWVDDIACSKPPESGKSGTDHAELVQGLKDATSTGHAFVVFETESARDRAVALAQESNGFAFKGCKIQLEACECEPTSVLWDNFRIDDAEVPMRILIACLVMLGLLAVWISVFFLPAAYYAAQYNEAKGDSPDWLYNTLLGLLVLIGNLIMYAAADFLASRIGFKQEDARQSAYVIMYVTACTVNVIMDFVFLIKTAYKEMASRGIRTDDGTKLQLLDRWDQVFEAYAMQREIGSRLTAYAWPFTFLIPFIMEGVMTNLLPYIVQRNLVRSKKGIVGLHAEKTMMFFAPMDLSRYGDVLLNVMLTVMIFFVPPGFLMQIIGGMVVSHIYIYMYDHFRVLRLVPAFSFSTFHEHKTAECLFAIPVGLLLAAGVFKSNCAVLSNGTRLPCAEGSALLGRCIMAFALHVSLHLFLLIRVIHANKIDKEPSTVPYEVAARTIPQTWFTTNPLHCLRSAHIYKPDKPHIFYVHGSTQWNFEEVQ